MDCDMTLGILIPNCLRHFVGHGVRFSHRCLCLHSQMEFKETIFARLSSFHMVKALDIGTRSQHVRNPSDFLNWKADIKQIFSGMNC